MSRIAYTRMAPISSAPGLITAQDVDKWVPILFVCILLVALLIVLAVVYYKRKMSKVANQGEDQKDGEAPADTKGESHSNAHQPHYCIPVYPYNTVASSCHSS